MKKLLKEVKRFRREIQREEMRVKDRDGNMLVEGNAVRHRWAEYYDEMLNVEDGVHASIVAVGGDRNMSVFGRLKRLNDGVVNIYEVEEERSKMKGGKATGFDQWAVQFLKKGGRTCSLVILSLGVWQRTGVGHASIRCKRKRETDASALTSEA